MQYHTVFDVSQMGYRDWWAPAAGLGLAVLAWIGATLHSKLGIRRSFSKRKVALFPAIPIGFCVLWSVAAFNITFSDYRRLRDALLSGKYETVEGVVTDFVPQADGDHTPESFVVAGQHFSYSFATDTASFHQTHTHGGPIHAGMTVRLAVVGDEIARVETAK